MTRSIRQQVGGDRQVVAGPHGQRREELLVLISVRKNQRRWQKDCQDGRPPPGALVAQTAHGPIVAAPPPTDAKSAPPQPQPPAGLLRRALRRAHPGPAQRRAAAAPRIDPVAGRGRAAGLCGEADAAGLLRGHAAEFGVRAGVAFWNGGAREPGRRRCFGEPGPGTVAAALGGSPVQPPTKKPKTERWSRRSFWSSLSRAPNLWLIYHRRPTSRGPVERQSPTRLPDSASCTPRRPRSRP